MFSLKKSTILLIGCIFILISASCAFASDLNQSCNLENVENFEMNLDVENDFSHATAFEIEDLETRQLDSDNTYNITENLEETDSSSEIIPASYDDLSHDIENLKPDTTYDIKKDYIIEDCGSDLSKNRIININADNVIINGNGHTINANGNKGYFAVFNITGNNVTIMNLNIINARIYNYDYSISYWNRYGNNYNRVLSPIEWHGDNGLLLNCLFDDNVGEEGGAIYWAGNNGLIDNCYFNNNAATIRGGSIFMCGYNNTIRNSIIKDSSSSYLDGIFLKNFNENGELLELNLNNCTFKNSNDYVKDFHVEGSCAIISDNRQIFPVIPAGSFNELREIIKTLKDGDVYTLTNDYYFDDNCYYHTINANNVIINGNGHKIYGSAVLLSSLLWVTGDNVTVTNLNFEFKDLKDEYYGASFVNWKGNNGVLENCTFIGNQAQYGGAINWEGNDGLIDNCVFINNTAHVAGGAIFISGENNRIANSIILNSNSELTGEAIFIDYKRKNLTLENIFFNNETAHILDAGKMNCNINVAVIVNDYRSSIGSKDIFINELIYQSIIKGGIINLNEYISYYSSYYNESGDFIFTITRNYGQYGISYVQDYHFKDIYNNTFSDIFTKLLKNDFETKITLTKTAYVSSESDYNDLLKELYAVKSFIPIQGDLDNDKNFIGRTLVTYTYALNVVFNKTLTIYCDEVWNLDESSYDMLIINGAGSTIRASFEDRQEDKWIVLSENMAFYAHNITLEGFNTVIENMGGQCLLDNVNFNKNKMDYIIDRDWGAAIINTGIITCINCSFTNNYAKNGGAIFNQGLLTVMNCTFANNTAYGEGNHICVGDGGQVIMDNVLITSNDQSDFVHIAESMSLETSALITVFSVGISLIVGTVVGFLTANPIAGAIAGTLVGAAIGSASAAWIISEKFDVTYDRMKTILTLVIGSALAGGLGGCAGGAVNAELVADAAWIEANGGPELADIVYTEMWWRNYLIADGVCAITAGDIVSISYYFTN